MRFPSSLLDEIRARLPVSQVVARKVALKRAGRELKGLSPFKQERTPSFFVNDHKGSWFDFSSGQNGDIFKFVMLTEGLSFPEAVERLAQEAGLPLPAADRQESEQQDERARLAALMDAAVDFFAAQLAQEGGAYARRYLDRRGLSADTIARFRLGYAPNARFALKEHLAAAGFRTADMVACGMLIAGDDIPVAFDRFRHRIIFPLRDLKGRVIAFGGRALDPEAPAKYLNSPETALFHKGAILYNAHAARVAAHDKGRILVVEGYMDVIALAQAGFPEAVAPLGTALTEDQLRVLWRMAPEPVLCFDGDAAGRRAAFRAVETVLPHLKPGQSVRFAFLPEGLDPDDLIRQHGAAGFQEILDTKTAPLFDVLIEREERRGEGDLTPEQRALLQARLEGLVARIGDRSVRAHYERELRETLWARHRKLVRQIAGGGRRAAHIAGKRRDNTQLDWRVAARASERSRLGSLPRAAALATAPMRSNELAGRSLPLPAREALMIRTLLNHPWLLEGYCEDVAEVAFTSPPLARLRDALLELLARNISLERQEVRTQLCDLGLEKMVSLAERAVTHRSDKFAEPEAQASAVEEGFRHAFALHQAQVGLKQALAVAERDWQAEPSEEAWRKIVEIQERLAHAATAEEGGEA
jgi:DNA primase